MFLIAGCAESTRTSGNSETEGHAHPESYPEGVSQLKALRADVKAAFEAGTPQESDEALHEAAHVLDMLPDLAAETNMSPEDHEAVATASKELFDHFMMIHEGFHGDAEGASYDDVAEEINAAIETLQSKIGAAGTAADEHADAGAADTNPVPDHDHEND